MAFEVANALWRKAGLGVINRGRAGRWRATGRYGKATAPHRRYTESVGVGRKRAEAAQMSVRRARG